MTPGRRLTVALVGLIALVVFGWFFKDLAGGSGAAPSSAPPPATSAVAADAVPGKDSGLQVKALSSLPQEAAATWALIEKNGPFPYPRNDGVTFQNREKLLPAKADDYYREYTVPTPKSPDRGARRLITGAKKELYYTADHYDSFVLVDVSR